MQRNKEIPNKPRFSYAKQKAYKLLLDLGINSFPIKPEQIISSLPSNVFIMGYFEACKVLHTEDPLHIISTGAEGRSIKDRLTGRYFIVYDNFTVSDKHRINWTILHEIGHLLLGHLDDFYETALDRGGLTDEKYGILEVETNFFVSELLMPSIVLNKLKSFSAEKIALLFNVSDEASEKQYDRVFVKKHVYPSQYDNSILRNFYHFLVTEIYEQLYINLYEKAPFSRDPKYEKYIRKCPYCFSLIANEEDTYCYNCGKPINPEISFENWDSFFDTLNKRAILIDKPNIWHKPLPHSHINHSHLCFCPICRNSEIEGSHCDICGFPIVNFCTDCFNELPFNASFCTHCGGNSLFKDKYVVAESIRNSFLASMSVLSDTFIVYEYWDYVCMKLRTRYKTDDELISSLYLTYAVIDEDDNIIVISDNEDSSDFLNAKADIILSVIHLYDDFCPNKIMFTSINDSTLWR